MVTAFYSIEKNNGFESLARFLNVVSYQRFWKLAEPAFNQSKPINMKGAILNSIDKKFEMSWKRLAKEPVKAKKGMDEVVLQINRLKKCLKWSTAYSILQNHCAKIIQPYHNNEAITIIKWFWVEYGELNFKKDIAPTPKEFFEWYCDSDTIRKEIESEKD